MSEPPVLHADVDAFYASVAQRDDPALRGRPVAVGGGVVMAASYEARAYGVRGGMGGSQARRLCPGLVVVGPDWPAYQEAGRSVFEVFERLAARVERGSMEEAFLHPHAGGPPPAALAAVLRREVRERAGLPLSVGIARTRVLAKIASRSAKPDGVFAIAPADEDAFLRELPVERVWGVGAATAARLHAHGLRTVGQAAALEEPELMAILGKAAGRYLHAIAHRREPPPRARPRRGRRSYGAQRALGRGGRSRAELEAAVDALAGRLAERMARRSAAGRTVVLRLRFGDYTRAARSCTLPLATGAAEGLAAAARELLAAAMPLVERRGITLVGLTVTNLDPPRSEAQLALPLALPADGGDEA